MDHEGFVSRVMDIDPNIRMAVISDMDGNVKFSKQRENIAPFLSPDETKEALQHAVSSWKSRMKLYSKIGKGLYTLAVYEKLRRVTIPLKDEHLLLVSIDNKGGQKDIIDRILNQLYGDYTKF